MKWLFWILPLALMLLSGCAKSINRDDHCVASLIDERIAKDVRWNRQEGCCPIDELVQEPFTLDAAVQVALLNNPKIQVMFEEIGLAQADLIEAGLFQNPLFELFVRFPDRPHSHINIEGSLITSILDLFLIPLRTKVAKAELHSTQLRVAHQVLELAFEVQEIYYKLQAQEAKKHILQKITEAASLSSELAQGQLKAGNITSLTALTYAADYQQVKQELAQNNMEIAQLREQFNQLLGFTGCAPCWNLLDTTGEINLDILSCEPLLECALEHRLDLSAARWEVEKYARTGALKQWWTYTDAKAGISMERDPEGISTIGPAFSAAIPIFNYGQGERARVYALLRQSQERVKVLEIQAEADVRLAIEKINVLRNSILEYRNQLLPLQEQIVKSSLDYYHAMTVGVYTLLENKRRELQTQINYQMALRDYLLATVALQKALYS